MKNIREVEQPDYDKNSPARVTEMGNVTEVVVMQKPVSPPPIRKIDADHYVDLRTGEVFEYDEHGITRADNTQGIRRTLAHIRNIINTNVTEPDNVRWITLTYAENMTDPKRLYKDYEKFWKKFCYWCKTQGYQKPEYISVIEPQGRGAWHAHAFFIWNEKAPYIPNNDVLQPMWGHGWTKTKALTDVDNVGAYFSAYLADMPLDEYEKLPHAHQNAQSIEKEFTNDDGLTKTKKFVKGGRLALYPAKMNIVRKSSGIKVAVPESMTFEEAQKKASSAKLTFSRSYEVVGDDGVPVNVVTKSYYNSKRAENQ